MAVIVVATAKHSPGATTTALALADAASAGGRPVVVVEADPAGGDVAARFGLSTDPGLVSLAAAARRDVTSRTLDEHTQVLPSGVRAVVAPTSVDQAAAALRALADAGPALWAGRDVVIDVGRLDPSSPALFLAAAAGQVVWVTRPTVEGVEHVRSRAAALRGVCRSVVVLVGERPYTARDVTAAIGLPVVGVLADDSRGAAAVATASRAAWASVLARSARSVLLAVSGPAPRTSPAPPVTGEPCAAEGRP